MVFNAISAPLRLYKTAVLALFGISSAMFRTNCIIKIHNRVL